MPERKLVFISGVSSGFGKLTLSRLLRKGHVVVAGLRGGESRMEALFSEERKQFPGRLHAVELSLEKSEDLRSAAQLIDLKFGGKLDVLINNAGYGLLGVIEDQTEEQIRYQMEVNFFGAAFLTRALLPALRRARGRILNVSSIAGRLSFPFYASYSASKFALEGLSEGLYYDLRPFGVQVGLIEPGGFKTGFTSARQFGELNVGAAASPYGERTEAFQRLFEMTRARLDDPEKVARLIDRLCDSRHVPLRNPIGRDARLAILLDRILPARLYYALMRLIFNFGLRNALKNATKKSPASAARS